MPDEEKKNEKERGEGKVPPGEEKERATSGPSEESTDQQQWDPPVGEFPEIAWRGTFDDYRQAMRLSTSASDTVHFVTFWSAVAASLGRRISMFYGTNVYPNVYLGYYGPTGDKKTTAQRRILDYSLLGEREDVPILRTTGSAEGLADAFAEVANTGVCIFYWEEFAETLARAHWSGATLCGFLTETFDCPPVFQRAYRKNPIRIDNPTPTVLTATTPEWLWQHMQPQDFYGGFGNRYQYFTGIKKPSMPTPQEPDSATLQFIRSTLGRLRDIEPVMVVWTPDAKQRWIEFYLDWDSRMRRPLVMAATKRVDAYVIKLAMTYAALEKTLPWITLEQLEAAIAVGLHAAACAEYLVDLQTIKTTAEGELTEFYLKWVREHPGERLRVMQQRTWKRTQSAEKFNRLIENLCRADRIEIRDKRVFLAP
jgi:hypothetical protein